MMVHHRLRLYAHRDRALVEIVTAIEPLACEQDGDLATTTLTGGETISLEEIERKLGAALTGAADGDAGLPVIPSGLAGGAQGARRMPGRRHASCRLSWEVRWKNSIFGGLLALPERRSALGGTDRDAGVSNILVGIAKGSRADLGTGTVSDLCLKFTRKTSAEMIQAIDEAIAVIEIGRDLRPATSQLTDPDGRQRGAPG